MKYKREQMIKGIRCLPLVAAIAAGLGGLGAAQAFEIDSGNPDIGMRWDNTLRYNLGVRAHNPSNIGNDTNYDESDYKFPNRGDTVTDRIDLLSEFDFTWRQDQGFRISAAAWYDDVYSDTKVKRNPKLLASASSYAANGNQYTDYTKRYYRGPSGEILDAFVFGKFNLGDMPLDVKAGQHTVIWGESLFTVTHGISYGQSPLDLAKAFATPGIEAKELYRPLSQISMQLGVSNTLSLAAQYFFDWDYTRIPEGGTYLGVIDFGFAGPTQFAAGVNRGNNDPKKHGDWGIAARWSPEWLDGTLGFYYRNFTDKLSSIFRFSAVPVPYYKQYYAEDIDLYGISLSKQLGSVSVGAEVSYRHNTPLYAPLAANLDSAPATFYPHGVPTLIGNSYQARGNTLHALVNGVAVLPKVSLGDMTLFDTAALLGELTYSRLESVTANQDMFKGLNYGVCNPAKKAALGGSFSDIWSQCATRDAYQMTVVVVPSWLQVFPGMDLSAPISFSKGLYGNSPLALGGNVDNGSYSYGLGLDVYAKYRFDLKYVGYFGHANYAAQPLIPGASQVTTVNGLSTLLRDRDFVALTFKTTF